MTSSLYFAHAYSTYNTKAERVIIEELKKRFPEYRIVNPKDHLPGSHVKLPNIIMDFLSEDSCGECYRADSCRIGHFLNMVLKARIFVRWDASAKCGVECETRFAECLGRTIHYVEECCEGIKLTREVKQ